MIELGGSGPVLHLACANGFPPETYRPALSMLFSLFRVLSFPPRALWPGIGEPPKAPGSWQELADDLLAGLRDHHLEKVVAVGHSFGGVATLLAAAAAPERFRGLALLDPTIFPQSEMDAIRAAQAGGAEPRFPLVDGALKRKDRFASGEEAFAYWRGKHLFADWSDEILTLYVEAMLVPDPRGTGWVLRWPRAWEAWYYRSFFAGSWEVLQRIPGDLPLLVVRGERSDTFVARAEAEFRSRRPGTAFAVVRGHGHLFPQSAPAVTAGILQQWAASLG